MPESTHAEMHRDHEHWLSDCAMWRDDVAVWKGECRQALADLQKIEAALRRLSESVDFHESTVSRHVDKITTHEHCVSAFEQTKHGDTVEMLTFAKAHREEAAGHQSYREAHEQLKKEHFTVMAHWKVLLRELTKSS